MPAPTDDFAARVETGPDLAAALPAGAAVALVPARAAGFSGAAAAADVQDWLRSSGKTQLAAAFAESLWQSGGMDLLVWIEATSRAAVLSGYAAAMAAATGRDQASSCESVAAQFLGWLGETSRSWLVVLDDLTDAADLDGLWPVGPGGPGAGDRRRFGRRPRRHARAAGRAVQPARGHQPPERTPVGGPGQAARRNRAGA